MWLPTLHHGETVADTQWFREFPPCVFKLMPSRIEGEPARTVLLKTNCCSLTHHAWKMSPHYLVKRITFSSDWRYVAFFQTLVGLKKTVVGWHWWLWKEPVVMYGKWSIRETLQQMFKVTIFCTDTCFQSFSPLINCIVHQAVLKFSPCRNKTLLQLIRIANWYSISVKKMKKMKNLCILQGSAVTLLGVVGKGVTVCFLLTERK